MITLSREQAEAVTQLCRWFKDPRAAQIFEISGYAGVGKCLKRDTPVLMHNGTIRPVQDVQVGDLLMGPDSQPRRVLNLSRGHGPLYKVTPTKGDPYVVNENHVLSLKMSFYAGAPALGGPKKGAVVNVGVKDFLRQPKSFQIAAKGYRVGVDFPAQEVPLDPYFLGLWLGDGHTGAPRVTTADPEVVNYLADLTCRYPGLMLKAVTDNGAARTYALCNEAGRQAEREGRWVHNPIITALRQLGVYASKHVPTYYKANARPVRLGVLAGLLDADGDLTHNTFTYCSTREGLADDAAFLARSLGFAAYKKKLVKRCMTEGYEKDCETFVVTISGHVDEIPTRIARKQAQPRKQVKDVLRTGITVEPIGDGDYFGFEVDADHLFLLGDFTVTHNSTVVKYAIEALELAHSDVGFVTFTGKAALVLTKKGTPAMTIHRFCYEPLLSTYRDQYNGLPKTKVAGFRLRQEHPDVKLIVIDEVSMVSVQLLKDLRSFGIKILALGDPGQLPPVMSAANGMLVRPDVFLDKIHRQAADSPIIWASMLAREGRNIPLGRHGDALEVVPRSSVTMDHVLGVDQVITCTHRNRVTYNTAVREYLGYDTKLPIPGEKLICLSNRWETISTSSLTPLVNGLQVRVVQAPERISRNLRSFWTTVELDGAAGDAFPHFEVNLDWFEPRPGIKPDTDADLAHFDYSYAITCHKSQGSEWPRVLAVTDTFGDHEEQKKQRYTEITRASEYLMLAI